MSEYSSPIEVVDDYIDAYNAFDVDRIGRLLADDIYLTHKNRGFLTEGKDPVIELYRGTPSVIPDRALVDRTMVTTDGTRVIVQHTFTGTPTVDLTFGPAGEKFSIFLATVFTIEDGKVTKYEDYG
ncbi:nuclear transport factor 2 family protein [Cryobacterium sp. TMS1-20-1]|uniref:nuclear transport factor 2 family protein n=1 Tax=Cryobacterium sp. TMS1-20-1 TaxID=1259223 RepID=UPI0010695E36|nr:nuclear transport factor 2 family protein [Cryobacterium sp. TMS1-20-1]TFC75862.1 nuclear transport factor 2 family protein [Cryobacterium sp. TMS1-20-1]